MSKNLLSLVRFLLMLAIGAASGYAIGKFGFAHVAEMPKAIKLFLIVLMVPAFFGAIAFHEMGHAIAGKSVGFDFRMFVVGPLMWKKEVGVWAFQWNTNVNVSGGMVICVPRSSEDLTRRFKWFVAGGPVASFAGVLLFLGLAEAIGALNAEGFLAVEVLELFFSVTAFFSFFFFLITALPFRTGGFASDGARFITLSKKGPRAQFEVLLIQVVSAGLSGTRPSQLNRESLQEALDLAQEIQSPMRVYLYALMHQSALDRQDFREAEKFLELYTAHANEVPQGIRNTVWLDAAFFYAYVKNDKTQAESYWAKFKPSAFIPKAQVLATEAALHILKGEEGHAMTLLNQAKEQLPKMLDRGLAQALHDRIQFMQERKTLKGTNIFTIAENETP